MLPLRVVSWGLLAAMLELAAPARAAPAAVVPAEDGDGPFNVPPAIADDLPDDVVARSGLGFDSQVDAIARGLAAAADAFDGFHARAIMGALDRLGGVRAGAPSERLQRVATQARGPMLAVLASGGAGSEGTIALNWQQSLQSDASLGNSVRVRHRGGPIDARFDISGRLPLHKAGPLALRYDGAAWLDLLPALKVGAVAQGPLGALGSSAPGQVVGPEARVELPLLGGSLAAVSGLRMPLHDGERLGGVVPEEFHWTIGFRKAL